MSLQNNTFGNNIYFSRFYLTNFLLFNENRRTYVHFKLGTYSDAKYLTENYDV